MVKRVLMIFQSIIKFIPALLYSIVFLWLFYWQFIYIYDFIINHFSTEKLSVLYAYLFIYLFGVPIITLSFINILHKYLLKSKPFVVTIATTLLIFYGLSFTEFYHVIEYFIHYPLTFNTIMGMISFIVLSLGYTLYSMSILFFKESMPLSHIIVFLLIGILYTLLFIEQYGIPFSHMW